MPDYIRCAMCRVKVAAPPPPSWVEVPTCCDWDQAFLCEDCADKLRLCPPGNVRPINPHRGRVLA